MNRPRFFLLNSMVLVAVMAVSVRVCPGQVGALPVKFTVLPGVSTPVYLNVLPSAVCRLRETRATDDADDWEPDDAAGVAGDLALSGRFPRAEQNFLRVYSDADGNARFTVSPPARTSLIELNLKLRCRSNGVRQEYPIALRASDTATGDMPFPPANDPAVDQSNQTTLPALTGDALGLTNQELMRLGYPPRPDPAANPGAYQLWLNAVMQPITVLPTQTIAGTGVRFGTTNVSTSNWSGYGLAPDTNAYGYELVQGHWIVPSVKGELFRTSQAAEWVGMDGDTLDFPGLTDLVQAGTSQYVYPVALIAPPLLGENWTVWVDFAWSEVLPIQPVLQVVPSMPVHPGDGILCTVWVAWDQSTPDPSGGNVFFQFVNSSVTNGQGNPLMVTAQTRIVDNSGFNYLIDFRGKTSEWIVERPTLVQGGKGVGLFDLPNYQSQCFAKTQKNYDGLYIDATTAWAHLGINQHESFEYSGHDNFLFTMGGSTDLSIPTPLDSHSICFNWLAFH